MSAEPLSVDKSKAPPTDWCAAPALCARCSGAELDQEDVFIAIGCSGEAIPCIKDTEEISGDEYTFRSYRQAAGLLNIRRRRISELAAPQMLSIASGKLHHESIVHLRLEHFTAKIYGIAMNSARK